MNSLEGYLEYRFPDGYDAGDSEWRTECPVCHDPKCKAFINKDTGNYQCKHCTWRGNGWVSLIASVEGLSSRQEIGKWIGEHEIELKSKKPFYKEHRPRTVSRRLPPFCSHIKPGDPFHNYLKFRKLDWAEGMLRCTDGKYANRIIVPIYENGQLVFFFDRAIDMREKRKTLGIGSENEKWYIDKSEIICHIDNPTQPDKVVICEGIFSALSAALLSKTGNCVALLGKTCSDIQLHKIEQLGAHNIYLCLDPNTYTETLRLAERLNNDGFSVMIYTLDSTIGDPNDYLMKRISFPEPEQYGLRWRLKHGVSERKNI